MSEGNRRSHRYLIRVRCQLKGTSFSGKTCATMVWIDDISAGGAKVTFPPETQVTHKQLTGLHGTVQIRNLNLEFKEVYISNCFGIVSIGIKFRTELSSRELKKIIYADHSEKDNKLDVINFKTVSHIGELSLYETVGVQMSLCTVIDLAYQIEAEIYEHEHHSDLLFMSPRYINLNSGLPLQGSIEVMRQVADIIKSAEALLKSRNEKKMIRKPDLLTPRDKVRPYISGISSSEAEGVIKRNSREFEVFQKHIALLESRVTLHKDEVDLLREQLSVASDVFIDGSVELNLFKDKLLPRLMALFDDSPFRLELSYGSSS